MVKTADFCVFLHFSVPQDPPQGAKKFSKKKIFFHLKIALSKKKNFFFFKKIEFSSPVGGRRIEICEKISLFFFDPKNFFSTRQREK